MDGGPRVIGKLESERAVDTDVAGEVRAFEEDWRGLVACTRMNDTPASLEDR